METTMDGINLPSVPFLHVTEAHLHATRTHLHFPLPQNHEKSSPHELSWKLRDLDNAAGLA